ncbi:bifunctional adenosylcobinamide kinase/adenosylcobinamide-phosphate guanylyltransferase [Chthonobacter albigriseus]|uniref:bifunctional adenosylcobinamide kinase/adenosylcobinamide-phosphate guanylyltransferase n=1 Tax=Chthonobacter albigriseus TaxID=1683161 RepID=UPI0015EFAECF|nr:bifunctional adenosylcobinamide kinase/adenosylcobinamide-phosphate guanylyltransferase [Chthonobacter albigriseus]
MSVTLVLGGARSGKSRHAETLVRATGPAPWTYIATAQAFDAEMTERIAQHRADRAEGWITVDAPHDLPAALRAAAGEGRAVLVDCLTLWLSNRMLAEADLAAETKALVEAVRGYPAPLVVVSNEVGFGIVPDNALGRRFRDAQGRVNQEIAAAADRVVLVVAGIPVAVK